MRKTENQNEAVLQQSSDLATAISSKWIMPNRIRLDASYYTKEVFNVRKILQSLEKKRMEELAEVKYPTRFKRVYSDASNGIPFLSASEALFFRPTSTRYLSITKVPEINETLVKKGWLCLTRSGSVGRAVYVTERLSHFALTDDLLRIIPYDGTKAGYIYAFLSSWLGQVLLAKDQYGSAIKHLEPEHVGPVLVPMLSSDVQEEIHVKITQACGLREKANALLDEAEKLLINELGLQPIRYSSDEPHFFSIKAFELGLRLDAANHSPLLRVIAGRLESGRYPVVRLSSLGTVYIPPRFKRTFVGKEQGVPFLQGKHIVELKPYDIRFISKSATKDLNKWVIRRGMVLVTCSGTIGRVGLVPSAWDNWAATQHILRVIPEAPPDSGYLAVFLMSPYGYYQVTGKTYGGVIGEIAESHARQILVPDAPSDVRRRIGKLAVDAFEMKEEANTIEQEAVERLERELSA